MSIFGLWIVKSKSTVTISPIVHTPLGVTAVNESIITLPELHPVSVVPKSKVHFPDPYMALFEFSAPVSAITSIKSAIITLFIFFKVENAKKNTGRNEV